MRVWLDGPTMIGIPRVQEYHGYVLLSEPEVFARDKAFSRHFQFYARRI